MKTITIGALLTQSECDKAEEIYRTDRAHFHTRCLNEVVLPAMPRINETTEQENDPGYLTYALEYALSRANPN